MKTMSIIFGLGAIIVSVSGCAKAQPAPANLLTSKHLWCHAYQPASGGAAGSCTGVSKFDEVANTLTVSRLVGPMKVVDVRPIEISGARVCASKDTALIRQVAAQTKAYLARTPNATIDPADVHIDDADKNQNIDEQMQKQFGDKDVAEAGFCFNVVDVHGQNPIKASRLNEDEGHKKTDFAIFPVGTVLVLRAPDKK